jgi:hypothetical protein
MVRASVSRPTAALAFAALLVAATAGAAALPAGRALVVTDATSGERLLSVPVSEGDVVALSYTHSVERSRVLDVYSVRGDRLEMTRMEFESYGAGLPADAPVRTVDGRFVFDPEGSYAELYVAPGAVAGHRLHVGERSYDLVALSGGRTVRLTVERLSALGAVRAEVTRG